MPTVRKSVSALCDLLVQSSGKSSMDDMFIKEFEIKAKDVLNELRSFHETKRRQIELCFSKLVDNTSSHILDSPLSTCIAEYVEYEAGKENDSQPMATADDDQIIDQSLTETDMPHLAGVTTANMTVIDDEIKFVLFFCFFLIKLIY